MANTKKTLTPRQSARKRITAAKKALREGKAGASEQMDNAIKAFAKAACKVKSTPGTKRKTAHASVSGAKKKTKGRKSSTRSRKRK